MHSSRANVDSWSRSPRLLAIDFVSHSRSTSVVFYWLLFAILGAVVGFAVCHSFSGVVAH